MANLERLTKRVKKLEEWIEENEDMGGPKGLIDTMSFLVQEMKSLRESANNASANFYNFRNLTFEFLKERKMEDEWDKWLKDKDAVQEQETESVPVRDEPEASEGVREEDAEEQKTTE
jgi:hypothetical protein